ncbi:hypothetical protein C0585_08310 [Candidatus Woesearchaeota archaeon]|nr:MAG: hypothetical protein C0585_08310 [Candidatus Woesearchaeota archaeon]
MSIDKKTFFKERSPGQIKKFSTVKNISDEYVHEIEAIELDEAVILETQLIPKQNVRKKKFGKGFSPSREFRKYGGEVHIKSPTLEEIASFRPVDARFEAMESIDAKAYNGLVFTPFSGDDLRPRKIPLIESLEGAKLYAYACLKHRDEDEPFSISNYFQDKHFKSIIELFPYDDARGVEMDGAEIDVKMPSRHKTGRYKFKLTSVPVIDNENKQKISYSFNSTHECDSKRGIIRFKHPQAEGERNLVTLDSHDVAAYLAVIDMYSRQGNIIPLEQSQIPIPTQRTVDFYEKLNNNVLIKDNGKTRPLNLAEKEILLWGLVYKTQGSEKPEDHPTFFAKGTKVRDYQWRV